MAQVINTNSLSLLTQNNLNASQSSLNTAIQRLSSGLRINSAKDDAAGQAIANRFTANIRGLSQAQRNANDGISLAQTTEGALTEVNNNLQRIRELAVQAANGSNNGNDLDSIQDEITQRLAEIDRISGQTDFNGVKVLSSSAKPLTVQVGANDGETIAIDLEEISSTTLSLSGFNVNGGQGAANTAATAATAADLLAAGYTTTGVASGGFTTYTKASAGQTVNNAAATAADVLGEVANGGTVTSGGRTYVNAGGNFTYTSAAGSVNDAALDAAITPASGTLTATVTIGGSAQNVVIDSTGNMTDVDGNQLYIDGTGNLTLTNAGTDPTADVAAVLAQMQTTGAAGDSIKLTSGADTGTTYTMVAADSWTATQTLDSTAMAAKAATSGATIDLTGDASTDYTVAAGGAVTNAATAAVYVDAISSSLSTSSTSQQTEFTNLYVDASGNVSDSNVDADADGVSDGNKQYLTGGALTAKAYVDANGAATSDAFATTPATADPLKALDAALSKVDKLRSSLGAVQNRFDSVISNLGTTITNLSSSRSRIQDADYAVEVSNMTRAQILQQAGTSVLAQANQTTQGVLSLLR